MVRIDLPRAVALLAVLAVLATAVAPAAAAAATDRPAVAQPTVADQRSADLVVRQPHYVDGEVQTQTDNGTTVYRAQGEVLYLKPQNFDPAAVQNVQLASNVGTITYDADLEAFRLAVGNNTGSFAVTWTVSGAAGTNNSTAAVVQYHAVVQVTGGTGYAHVPQSEYDRTQQQADNWQQVVERADVESVEEAVRDLQLVNAPLAYLTGTFTEIGILLVFSGIGGWLWIALGTVPVLLVAWKLRGVIHDYRQTEQAEGDIADREVRQDRRRRQRRFAQVEFEDWFPDAVAVELRDLADSPKDLYRLLFGPEGALSPAVVDSAHLQAMGQQGWTATVERDGDGDGDGDADGDSDGDGAIESATLVREDAVAEDAETVDLTDHETVRDLVPHVQGQRPLAEFDIREADIDDAALTLPLPSLDNEGVVEAADWDHPDPDVAAERLAAFVERFEDHPVTDDSGQPQTVQEILAELHDLSMRARDDVGVPDARRVASFLGRAQDNSDWNDRTEQHIREVRDGVRGD